MMDNTDLTLSSTRLAITTRSRRALCHVNITGLSDSATLAGCGDVYPGTLTFGLTGPPGFLGGGPSLVTVQAPGDGNFNIGKGVPPTVPGTYVWVVIFTAKDGSSVSSPTETPRL
jgi:hypothetical protein